MELQEWKGGSEPTREQVYKDTLTGPRFALTGDLSESLRKQVRNGIMHDAETRNRWLVKKTVPCDAVGQKSENGDYELNRTKFRVKSRI